MSFIDQIKQSFDEQFKKRDASVLGIDIGSSAIKLVQLRNEQGAVLLETYGEIALGPFGDSSVGAGVHLPPEMLAKALQELIQGSGVTTTNCGVSVPFSASLVKLIEIPAVDQKQLATVIPIEARKYVPVPITEVQLDWFVVPETEQRLFDGSAHLDASEIEPLQKRLVLIVAMHNKLLQEYAEVFKLVGLTPDFYEIEVFSNIRSTIDRSLAPVAVLDLGAVTSKLCVVELGIILASHVVQKGSQDITRALSGSTHMSATKAEQLKRQAGIMVDASSSEGAQVSHAATLTMEQVFSETRRVLIGFQRRYNKVITKVILTGGGAMLKGIEDFARQQLEVEVEIAKPFAHVQTPVFLDEVLKKTSPDFSVAVGLALRALHENKPQ
ncbi:MAG: type IV pilus assembly protein PilM [Candidatus Pacebacteria bacterium]|nr:type IV pilus assembly protein PilM [Candidatus Paceibacterota bacterium]